MVHDQVQFINRKNNNRISLQMSVLKTFETVYRIENVISSDFCKLYQSHKTIVKAQSS